MTVININSEVNITQAQIDFVEKILLFESETHKLDSLYMISKNIPIFLLNEESMKKNDNSHPNTKWLGYYKRSDDGIFEATPIIVVSPQRIQNCIKNSDEEFLFLFAKVVIHELAYAKMDFENDNKYENHDDIYKWIEESIANRLTLELIRNFKNNPHSSDLIAKSLFDFIKNFIDTQEQNYSLELFNNVVENYRELKKNNFRKNTKYQSLSAYKLSRFS